jgi:hypothetical protein
MVSQSSRRDGHRGLARFLSVLALLCGVWFWGCGDTPDGGDPPPPAVTTTPDPASVEWRATMELEELLAIAELLGLNIAEGATKDEVVAALEDATGCGCFGAICGMGACDHACGTCAGDAKCYGGFCETAWDCPVVNVVLSSPTAMLKDDTETIQFRYEAEVAGPDFDMLRIESQTASDAGLGPGTYDLRHFDPGECELCVTTYSYCSGSECAETWIAMGGMVQLDEAPQGGTIAGHASNLKLEQGYRDPKTGNVFPLPNAQERCVDDYTFASEVDILVIEPSDCDPAGTGNMLGDKIGDFTVQNCLGEEVNLHQVCGTKAVWLVAAAGW